MTELEPGERGVGIRRVTSNEPWFPGHFPDHPVLPGVLIIEACAQVTGIVCGAGQAPLPGEAATGRGRIEYLASVERFKFVHRVVPGDLLVMESRIDRRLGGFLRSVVRAHVAGRLVARGALVTTISATRGMT